jgi:acyl-CoA reductase-like NAD-dependent aldehyde dehydrogenase
LNRFADNLEKNAEELATIESTDNGKPMGMALYDIGLSVSILRYYAGWTEKLQGITVPMTGPFMSYTRSEPIGVCGQIVPWNFPILMATFKLAPVLATGCTAILKPAENTPLSALKLGELLLASDMPQGVVNILPGLGNEAGAALVSHPGVDKIAFTGSTAVGKEILRESSYTLKRVGLELGGKSPMIILEDADIELALASSNFACFLNSG